MSDRYRLGTRAIADLQTVLLDTERMFGHEQRVKYTDLFHHAARLIAAEPRRVGAKSREDLRSGVRSFHLDRAAGRHGASAHMLYYVETIFEDGEPGVTILRILHHHMDPGRHLVGDLS